MGKIIITNIWGKHKDISVVECIEEKTSKEKIKFFSFINTEDKFINQCRYESVFSFNDGMAKVKMNSCWGVIDKNGVYIIEIDSFGKKAVKEEAQMIQQNFGMRNMQKTSQLRLPLQILKDKAKIKNNFSFFN